MGQNSQEYRLKYWATRSSVHSLPRGKVNYQIANLSVFFSIFDHRVSKSTNFVFDLLTRCKLVEINSIEALDSFGSRLGFTNDNESSQGHTEVIQFMMDVNRVIKMIEV